VSTKNPLPCGFLVSEFFFAKLHLKHLKHRHPWRGNKELAMSNFRKGFVAGVLVSVILFGLVFAVMFFRGREKELIEYVERQEAIEALREDYGSRDFVEFLDDVPGVRQAADGTATEFDKRVDEILQRFRNRIAD